MRNNNNPSLSRKEVTIEMLEKWFTKILNESEQVKNKSLKVVSPRVYYSCHGTIDRASQPFACDNSECLSCSMFHKLLAEEAKKFIKNDKNFNNGK